MAENVHRLLEAASNFDWSANFILRDDQAPIEVIPKLLTSSFAKTVFDVLIVNDGGQEGRYSVDGAAQVGLHNYDHILLVGVASVKVFRPHVPGSDTDWSGRAFIRIHR